MLFRSMVLADGSVYVGAWRHGQKHGRGELVSAAGFRYKGAWSNDVMEGKGEATYPDGARYEGSFRDGLRDGRGTLFFPHQQQYSGRFTADAIDVASAGTLLMPKTVLMSDTEWMIPINVQTDVAGIHARAGFDRTGL